MATYEYESLLAKPVKDVQDREQLGLGSSG